MCPSSFFLVRIGRLFVQFILLMCNLTISSQTMILVVNVLHHFPVADRIKPLLHMVFIALIESIPELRHHGLPQRLLILKALPELLLLFSILSRDHRQCQHAKLLHPVFLNDFPDLRLFHKHRLLKRGSMIRLNCNKELPVSSFPHCSTTPYIAAMRRYCNTIPWHPCTSRSARRW